MVRQHEIIDAHEHIRSREDASRLLSAMDAEGIVLAMLVASPRDLLFADPSEDLSFRDPEWNNEEILAIARAYPTRFRAFATFSPPDENAPEKLAHFLERGGTGLKLYGGHYLYRGQLNVPLDAPHLMKLYAYCEKHRIPIVFHANARFYWEELKRVLDAHPRLVVNLPHFCMALIDMDRMQEIFDRYPNVYTDVSFGAVEHAYPALEWVSERRDAYRAFVQRNRERFLFAADLVLTDHPMEDVAYIRGMLGAYRDFLEKDLYTSLLIDQYLDVYEEEGSTRPRNLNGLALDSETLQFIYERNPRRFLGEGSK